MNQAEVLNKLKECNAPMHTAVAVEFMNGEFLDLCDVSDILYREDDEGEMCLIIKVEQL